MRHSGCLSTIPRWDIAPRADEVLTAPIREDHRLKHMAPLCRSLDQHYITVLFESGATRRILDVTETLSLIEGVK